MSDAVIIEDQIERLEHVILASEDWAKSYKNKPEVLAKLIKAEAKLSRIMRGYFSTLAKERVTNFINWQLYSQKLIKAYNYNVIVDVEEIDAESNELISLINDPLLEVMSLGAMTAEAQYNIDIGLTGGSQAIMKANTKYVADLVTNVTNTTKDRIKQSIDTSIRLGENTQQAAERLRDKVINDVYRAELIARTETVRAYNQGITVFGQESNATGKIWEISSAPCEICQENDNGGQPIPFDEDYPSGDSEPPAHPNCRCGESLVHSYE